MVTDGTSPRTTEPVFNERRKVIRLRSLSNPEIEVDVDFLSQQVYGAGRIRCARVAPVPDGLTPRRSACGSGPDSRRAAVQGGSVLAVPPVGPVAVGAPPVLPRAATDDMALLSNAPLAAAFGPWPAHEAHPQPMVTSGTASPAHAASAPGMSPNLDLMSASLANVAAMGHAAPARDATWLQRNRPALVSLVQPPVPLGQPGPAASTPADVPPLTGTPPVASASLFGRDPVLMLAAPLADDRPCSGIPYTTVGLPPGMPGFTTYSFVAPGGFVWQVNGPPGMRPIVPMPQAPPAPPPAPAPPQRVWTFEMEDGRRKR